MEIQAIDIIKHFTGPGYLGHGCLFSVINYLPKIIHPGRGHPQCSGNTIQDTLTTGHSRLSYFQLHEIVEALIENIVQYHELLDLRCYIVKLRIQGCRYRV